MINATNVTGWNNLLDGHPVSASYALYNVALQGWAIGILFIVFETMLLIKTRNPVAAFFTSLLFLALYVGSSFLQPKVGFIMLIVITLELASILYLVIFK